MVQFGKRFETSQTRRWLRHNADYERLKLLLNLAGAAREREPAEKTTGLNNFGDRDNAGLLESDVVLAPGVFDSGLEALEKQALETLWRKNRKRGPLAKSTSLSNMECFAFASPGSPTSDADDDAWHWTRWLFSSRLPRSYALLAHGFDVALVAELDKVDALYARELRVLKSR